MPAPVPEIRQDLVDGIVAERAAKAQSVFAGIVQLVIELGHPGHIVQMVRSVKAVAAEIQSSILAECGVVAHRILVQDFLVRQC